MLVTGTFSRRRLALIFVVTGFLLWWLVSNALNPLRLRLSERFTARGDGYFVALDYPDAVKEYDHALSLNPKNAQATTDRAMAEKATTDPQAAKSFFTAHAMSAELDKLNRAQATFTSAKKALEAGVALYATADYGYARYPLETAVKLDAQYPEAWDYLGLDYQKLAATDSAYTAKAADAFKKRDLLTPNYIK